MPANLAINRAGVEAGATTDAEKHFPHLGIRQGVHAPIVNQHHMHLVRTIFTRAPRAGEERGVSRQLLPRARTPQQPQENARSAKRGISFSIPTSATCTLGTVVQKRMFPSFSTNTTVPVSATRKLPPLIPMSALANLSRRTWRAIAVRRSGTSVRSD